MGEDYPPELSGLARNIDRFIDHEISSRDRYRTAMDDLAHSLKTPLAVFRNALSSGHADDQKLLRDQLDRMETTVAHQLSRAMAARPVVLAGWTAPAPVADRLIKALRTAYVAKSVTAEQHIPAELVLRCDERDLMEMLGNLLENAFKYCRSKVVIGAEGGAIARLMIDDDGPGVPAHQRVQVLARGARGDTVEAGHGIGSRCRRGTRIQLSRRIDDRRVAARRRAGDSRVTGGRVVFDVVEWSFGRGGRGYVPRRTRSSHP